MKKRIGRRLVSLLLTVVTILTMLPAMTLPALAATEGNVPGLTGMGIKLSFKGEENIFDRKYAADDPWKVTDGPQINGHVVGSVNWRKKPCSDNSTLTITNIKGTKATLSFDYTIKKSSEGMIQVDGRTVTEGGTFSKELEKEKSITVFIDSGKGGDQNAMITMSNVKLVADATATVTFLPAENGSYNVNESAINNSWSNTQSSSIPYKVDAKPAQGYQFMDWYDVNNKKSISRLPETELNIEKDCTIKARFTTSGSALFEINSQNFDDLNEAVAEAKNQPATITLVSSGKIMGNYMIPSNVTLLIPFDSIRTDYTTMPGTTGQVAAKQNQRVYTTLTMDEGSQITVYGNISLPAQVSSANSSYTGVISGPCGTIHMKPSSSIVLKDGSNLYCWGFITGTGHIKAESGATVYEEFQICDYRGGLKTLSLNTDKRVFPFTQYYIQNIEATLEIKYGAKEIAVCRLHSAGDFAADVSLNFITRDSGGLFNLQSGSSFVKKYDSATERVTYEVIGDANLNSITIDAGAKVNSANFNLPIMQNTTINVKRGTTTLKQSLCLIPGSQVIVDEGATINIASGKSLYVYDRSDWVYKEWDKETITVNGQQIPKYKDSGFTLGGTDFKPEYYTPSRSSDSWKSHFTTADMKDVKFDINGTLNVAGKLYTTKGGADITSSLGSGKIVLSAAPTDDVITYQYMQSRKTDYDSSTKEYKTDASGYKNINATPAKLHNKGGSYTPTAGSSAGATFTYCTCTTCGGGKWTNTNDLQVAAIINGNGEQEKTCATLQAAVNAYTPDNSTAPTNYIKLLHNTTEKPISVSNKSLRLDLNGRTVTGDISVTGAYKLYGMDNSSKEYIAPSGKIVGTVKGCAPTYQTPGDTNDCYVAIQGKEADNETANLSFHRFNISVTGYRFELAAPECALFFIGKFQGDDAAKNHLTELGFTLEGNNNNQLGEDSYKFTAGTVFPPMPNEGEASDSKVVCSGDAYLFEAYLKRSFNKENHNGYTEEIGATARAKFDNGGTQESTTQHLSFEDAWTNPGELDPAQQKILDKFLKELGITKQAE